MIGPLPHSHPGTVGIVEKTELSAKIKMAATDRNTLSAMNLVERSILDGGLANYVPNPQNLKRMVNRSRQKGRPAEPKNVYSTIVPSYVHVPNEFLISDIKIEDEAGRIEARHLLLASETQIGFLKRASTWYIDGTFKAADDKLFKQAFGIHAFLHCGDNIKQVPLLTVLMTRRTKADYRAVFTDIARYLGSEIGLEDCLMDFEIATWKIIREVFPAINIHGCLFHYTKAIYAKVGDYGLIREYKGNVDIRSFIRKLFALPLLPARDMRVAFQALKANASIISEHENLPKLMQYMENQWFRNPTVRPQEICQYRRLVRTNNDVEGYHRRLNIRIENTHPPLYQLLEVIWGESQLVDVTAKIVSSANVRLERKRKTLEN